MSDELHLSHDLNQEDGSKEYTADSIQVLEGLEAVRKRPGMYIGNVNDLSGLHQLVYEVVDNSIDEALAGYCNEIIVTIHEDNSVTVRDNGRGIPTEIHKKEGKSAAEVIMTVLHAGGKFDNNSYKVSGGLHGVGVSCVNALSKKLVLDIYREGHHHHQEYERGVPLFPLRDEGPTEETGTAVTWLADDSIFTVSEYDFDALSARLRELSYLNSGVRIVLNDERTDKSQVFQFEGGLSSFVEYLALGKEPIHSKPIYILRKIEEEGITVEIALQWSKAYQETIYCFANNIRNRDGGTHESAFKSALTRVINTYATQENLLKTSKGAAITLSGEDIREGLNAIVSVKLPNPTFSNQTKDKLLNDSITPHISQAVNQGISEWLLESPAEAKNIIEKTIEAAQAREAARKARDQIRRKSALDSFSLPDKLSDCNSKDASKCELYLVEGDSAGGTAVSGRDGDFQAILPLRGKILNVEKSRLDTILASQSVNIIFQSLGTGIGDDFKLEKLRYHKIIIMTDADVDGSHIRTLLLAFFFRQMPRLVEGGHIYIAQPPLFKVEKNGKVQYLKDEQAYDDYFLDCSVTSGHVVTESNEEIRDQKLSDIFHAILFYDQYLPIVSGDADTRIIDAIIKHVQLEDSDFETEEKLTEKMSALCKYLNDTYLDTIFTLPRIDKADNSKSFSAHWISRQCSALKKTDLNLEFLHRSNFQKLYRKYHFVIDTLGANFVYYAGSQMPKNLSDPEELLKIAMDNGRSGHKIQRYKGLGEMNKDQLWETTMDPARRTLKQVKITDAQEADAACSLLMGDVVEPRKQFIIENSEKVRNLDI
ncbi:MAG: DNA topoisomerase (ATP-hydrolyzing) subunit B [Proteobacteria bacterium]|nr:DNA topoisomerase (ATP-hydrolyzing) subunit B [Pseudomonadota bacterium]